MHRVLSSALVESRKAVPLSAPPGAAVVRAPEAGSWCVTLGHKLALRTEVVLKGLALQAADLIVLQPRIHQFI